MLYEFSRQLICETDWTPPELARCGEFTAEELGYFFNPRKYGQAPDFRATSRPSTRGPTTRNG